MAITRIAVARGEPHLMHCLQRHFFRNFLVSPQHRNPHPIALIVRKPEPVPTRYPLSRRYATSRADRLSFGSVISNTMGR